MKRLLLAGLLCIVSAQAAHHMQSEEAKRLEADYKKESEQNEIIWKDHWESIERDALRFVFQSADKIEKERYESMARCARFLKVHHNYYTYRDRINQVTQGIPENELDTVKTKGFGHPLCQRIEKECDDACKEQLVRDARSVMKMVKLKATWSYWGYGWSPQWGYYDVDQKLIADQSIVSDEMYPESATIPEPDIAKKAAAILACQKCVEHGNLDYKSKQKFDERFFGKKSS